jgi:hypothetical protein
VNKNVSSIDLQNRLIGNFTIEKQTLEQNFADLLAFGLIDKQITPEQVASFRKENQYLYDVDDHSMSASLAIAGISYDFDTEPNIIPVDYDELLKELLKLSKGKIEGVKLWNQTHEDASGENTDYVFFAVYENKCFVMKPEDLGDWYDMERFDILLKLIAKEAGIKETFVNVVTGDQMSWYIFGEPDKVSALNKKYKLDLVENEEE